MENKKEPQEKSKTFFPLVLLIVIILGIIGIMIYNFSKPSITGNVINDYAGEQQRDTNIQQKNCKEVQVPYNDTEYTTISEPYTDNVCDDVSMVYKESYTTNTNQKDCIQQECIAYNQTCSQYNFWGNCVAYTNGNCANYKCVKYKISCGIKVENQEKQPLTYFINLKNYNYDTKQDSIIRVQNVYVAPLDKAEYLWDFTALPTDNLGCQYADNSAPTMKNCHDVIKYHDVQKTLIVTKYRTETECE